MAFFLLYSACWLGVTASVHFCTGPKQRKILPKSPPDAELGNLTRACSASGPRPRYPESQLIHELILQRAEARAEATALIVPSPANIHITYAQLQAAVLQLADALQDLGLEPGRIAALCMERSCAQVVAVLGVLASGGGYLPIDAAAPENRVAVLLQHSQARALLADSERFRPQAQSAAIPLLLAGTEPSSLSFSLVGAKPTAMKGQQQRARPPTSEAAMLIYTSGSTGAPKGIIYDHRHLLHGAWFWAEEHGVTERTVQLLKSPYFWAVMEWEFFPALLRGGSLVVASSDGHKSPDYMARVVHQHSVSVLMITPSVLDLLLDVHQLHAKDRRLSSLQHITTVGEPLPTALANRAVSMPHLNATIRNFYGASESSCTIYKVPAEGVDEQLFPSRVPAGLPQPYADVYLMAVDERPLRAAAPNTPGEICFGGILASGYLHLPELNKEKFVDTEYGRLYATGDLGRWTQGVLEVIGRIDRQLKVNGVRIEPEEVESAILKFTQPRSGSPKKVPLGKWQGGDEEMQSLRNNPLLDEQLWAVARTAVVATSSPQQLVAFVSPREGVELQTDDLHRHCKATLAPAYLPKHIVILEQGLPSLPNGKINFAELKAMAEEHVLEASQTVLDSLGQMRSMSKWAILENAVIHRCYAFWMVGVLLDHYALCAMTTDPNDKSQMESLAFCTTLASSRVAPWSEAIIRSIGNDQDLFGFIMLGAYQDSRPQSIGQRKRLRLSWMDLYILGIYLFIALPLPQMCGWLTRGFVYPTKTWQAYASAVKTTGWDQAYMEWADVTSGHRWYLLMVVQAKVYVVLCDMVCIPPWVQVGLAAWWSYAGPVFGGNVCTSGLQPVAKFFVTWLLDGCWIWIRWVEWYASFYVFCFHYLRPIVSRLSRRLPRSPTWAAAATAGSMILGMFMALFHYPNVMLESGSDTNWFVVELLTTTLQPALFALGTAYWPVNATWWGNTTLGCYVVHFLFRDRMTELFQGLVGLLSWDATGLLLPVSILLACVAFTSTIGPVGHYILILPQLSWARLKRRYMSQSKRALHMC